MKKTLLFLVTFVAAFSLQAQAKCKTNSPCGGRTSCHSPSLSNRLLFGKRKMESNRIIQYKIEYLQGEILDHDPKVSPLIQDKIQGVELALEFPRYGGESWHYYYNFPTVGWGFRYMFLGNPDYLGEAYVLYPYLLLPIIKSKFFFFNLKMGAGTALLTQKFDKKNYDEAIPEPEIYATNNYAISTNANLYLDLGLNAELKFSNSQSSFISRFSIVGDIGLNHFSNGSVRKPNTGLNMLVGGVGLKYSPYLSSVPMRAGAKSMNRKTSFEPSVLLGMNRQHLTDTRPYLNSSANIAVFKPLTNKYRMGIGLDLFYNSAFFADRLEPEYYLGETNQFRAGLSLANDLMFGDFIVGVHAGVYLVNQIEHDGRIYFKFVSKYKVHENWFLTAAVKTHMEVAECVEFGFGYALTKKEKAPFSWIPEKTKKEKTKKVRRKKQR